MVKAQAKRGRLANARLAGLFCAESAFTPPPPQLTRLCAANSRVVDGFLLPLVFLIVGAVSAIAEPASPTVATPVPSVSTLAANTAALPAPVSFAELLANTGRFVTCLAQDSRSFTWIGAEEGGLTCVTDGKVQTFGLTDGLTDDSPFVCIADAKGGLWVGNRSHGLSHFDGKTWKHFGVLDGLGGTRVYDLAIASDGTVWCATENGVSRFDGQAWQRFSAADGLPSGETAALAADSAGRIWAGGTAGGLAIFADGKWQQRAVDGPLRDEFINDILAAKDGTLWVACNSGLFRLDANAETWTRLTPAAVLKTWTENVISSLAETPTGTVLGGTRKYGILMIDKGADPATVSVRAVPVRATGPNARAATFVRSLLPLADGTVLAGTYGAGPVLVTLPRNAAASVSAALNGASKEGVGESKTPRQGAGQRPALVSYLGEDWQTQGDWIGNYGSVAYVLPAMGRPNDFTGGPAFAGVLPEGRYGNRLTATAGPRFGYTVRMGPNRNSGDSVRYWTHAKTTANSKSLQNPVAPTRRQSSWDDAGELYPPTQDGPDLYLDVDLPPGELVLSLLAT